jgi:HEAT repeat protein
MATITLSRLSIRTGRIVCCCVLSLVAVKVFAQEQTGDIRAIVPNMCSAEQSKRLRAFIDYRRLGVPQQLESLPDLIKLLAPGIEPACREAAARSLEGPFSDETAQVSGSDVELAINYLTRMLDDKDEYVQAAGADGLGFMGRNAKHVLSDSKLIELIRSDSDVVASAAEYAIGSIASLLQENERSQKLRPAIRPLMDRLGESEMPAHHDVSRRIYVRQNAAFALGTVGPSAAEAVPLLRAVVRDNADAHWELRLRAIEAIGGIGEPASAAATELIDVLNDPNIRTEVRSGAANSLGNISPDPRAPLKALVKVLDDENLMTKAAASLGRMAESAAAKDRIDLIPELQQVSQAFRKLPSTSDIKQYETSVNNAEQHLVLLRWRNFWTRIPRNPWILGLIAVATLVFIVLLLLRFFPLSILQVNDFLSQYDFQVPLWMGGFKVPIRQVLIIGFFHYHPRVLDSWIEKHLDTATQQFSSRPTVAEREVGLAAPLFLGLKSLPSLSVDEVQPLFERPVIRVLICGEGGSGKTSIACELAKWALNKRKTRRLNPSHPVIPVLLEPGMDFQTGGKEDLIAIVQQQLQMLTQEKRLRSEEFVQQLLSSGRVLLILDSVSEIDPKVKSNLLSSILKVPANSVVVTSRTEESFSDYLVIKPLRIASDDLASFMQAYLQYLEKRDLFSQEEFFESCRSLASIVGQRDVTPLLAKCFAEQVVASHGGNSTTDLPQNIPDVMINYVCLLHSRIENQPKLEDVLDAAKLTAWQCMKASYRPGIAKRKTVLQRLNNKTNPSDLLTHLETQLKLITRAGPLNVRFNLDTLAEYLASEHVIDKCRNRKEAWRRFLRNGFQTPHTQQGTASFLLALRDCTGSSSLKEDVKGYVNGKLTKIMGENSASV